MKKTNSDRVLDVLNVAFMLLFTVIILYPLYFTVIASFSELYDVAKGNVTFWIKGFTLEAYTNVFKNAQIWQGYLNSIIYTAVGTALNLALTIPAAYVLSKKDLPGRTAISWYFLFTMFFSGGLIPSYILIQKLGMLNRFSTLMILGAFGVYNMVIARVYFQTSIPGTLYEAAHIDGCGEFRAFFSIALPLAVPIIAVVALFCAVAKWNDYFTGLIYLSSKKLYPLQLVLRSILILNESMLKALDRQSGDASGDARQAAMRMAYMAQAMKYSLIMISSLPMLVAYPFVQKYFVKGMMVGSLKG